MRRGDREALAMLMLERPLFEAGPPSGDAWRGLGCASLLSQRNLSLFSARACALSLSLCSPLAFFSSCRFTEPFSGYVKERDEVLRVIAHLEERMKRKVVAIAGHSKGATVACLAASDYASNPNQFQGAVAAISGRHDLRQGVERSIGKKVVSSVMATREPQLVEIAKRRPFWLTAALPLTPKPLWLNALPCIP